MKANDTELDLRAHGWLLLSALLVVLPHVPRLPLWITLFAAGLGVVMIGFNGINALIGLKTGSPLLIMIVPTVALNVWQSWTYRECADDITCVVLDLTMPHMDGAETFGVIKQIRADVPVLLCSGYAEDVTQAFAGQDLAGFLQKPYRPRELVAQLQRILD